MEGRAAGVLIAASSFICGYLLGSVPFGLLLTRAAGLGDIRAIGSGNIGATNVLRTGRRDIALATLVLDAGKGAAAVLVAARWGETAPLLAGIGAILGHVFPVWLGFRGGKGVATGLAVLAATDWTLGVAACACWLTVFAIRRISSLAALAAFALAAGLSLALGDAPLAAYVCALAVLIFWRHEANIRRLLAGTEPRFGARR